MEEQKVFFGFLAKLFYLNLKETKTVSLRDFTSRSDDNSLMDDFFEKVKKCKLIFGKRSILACSRQKKRAYARFRAAVSLMFLLQVEIVKKINFVEC